MTDQTAKYLAWRGLAERGKMPWREEFAVLEQAGIVTRDKRNAILRDAEELHYLLQNGFCMERQALDDASSLLAVLGLTLQITDCAGDCLVLLRALEKTTHVPLAVWRQQLSAELFGDSKYIARTSILSRIYAQWLERMPSRGEIRLKAFSAVSDQTGGPDLYEITRSLGQAVFLPGLGDPARYDLETIFLVVTCENLSPFIELNLSDGLALYTGGYASRNIVAWLRALPTACRWIHFGDVDPDGLAIFDHLVEASGRVGRFFPDPSLLDQVRFVLPQWKGSRSFRQISCHTDDTRALAVWGVERDLQVEQEQLLHILRLKEIDFSTALLSV